MDPFPRFRSPLSVRTPGAGSPGTIFPEFEVMVPTVPVPPMVPAPRSKLSPPNWRIAPDETLKPLAADEPLLLEIAVAQDATFDP